MEARRAANLIDEREYYAAKLGFLNLNSGEQEQELQKEIARMQADKLIGKDKLENDKHIAEAQAKLAKVRADSVANVEVLAIQEAAANKKIAQSYVDAATAAQQYIDTVKKQNSRELEGIGKGSKFREQQSGRNQIEDQFTSKKQGLDKDLRNNQITQTDYDTYLKIAQDAYEKEVALYDERTAAINTAQGNWLNGATEAMQNYADNAANIAKQTEDLFTNAFQGMEDALVNFTKTGKLDFKSLANSIVDDITRIIIKQQLIKPLADYLQGGLNSGSGGGGLIGSFMSSLFGGGSGGGSGVSSVGSLVSLGLGAGRAIGGPVSAGGMYPVNEKGRPELLNVAGKQYLMMGNQSGSVGANSDMGGQPIMQTVNFYSDGPVDRHSQTQVAAAAYSGARRAHARNN